MTSSPAFTPPTLPADYAAPKSSGWLPKLPWIFGAIAAVTPFAAGMALLIGVLLGFANWDGSSESTGSAAVGFLIAAVFFAIAWVASLVAGIVSVIVAVRRGHQTALWSLVLLGAGFYPVVMFAPGWWS